MRTAVGQFTASPDWKENLLACLDLTAQAERGGADLLVLPEGVLARFTEDRHRIREVAQPLDGPFVSGMREATAGGTGPFQYVTAGRCRRAACAHCEGALEGAAPALRRGAGRRRARYQGAAWAAMTCLTLE